MNRATAPKKILLVEDDPNDRDLTVRTLQKHRICNEVVVVRDGAEALDYLLCRGPYAERDPRDLPAVVLLDLRLPKVDGLEVLKTIRETPETHLLPVVILTSSTQERDRLEGYRRGANSFVSKPVRFEEFAEAIRQLGLYWLLLNAPPPRPEPEPRDG